MCRCGAWLWCPLKPSKEKDSGKKQVTPRLTDSQWYGSLGPPGLICFPVLPMAQILCVQVWCPLQKPSKRQEQLVPILFSQKLVHVLCPFCFLRNTCMGTVPPPKPTNRRGVLSAILQKSQTLPKLLDAKGSWLYLCSCVSVPQIVCAQAQ